MCQVNQMNSSGCVIVVSGQVLHLLQMRLQVFHLLRSSQLSVTGRSDLSATHH